MGTWAWTVLCPDERIRNHPWCEEEDAQEVADYRTRVGCKFALQPMVPMTDDEPLDWLHPPCPGGTHVVVPSWVDVED